MDSDKVKIKKKEYLQNSYNIEKELERFLKGIDDTKGIDDIKGDQKLFIKDIANKDNVDNTKSDDKIGKLYTDPLDVGKEMEKLKPKENDPTELLTVSIKTGSPLQKYIEDPTENDALYASIDNNEPTVTILNNIMKEIAEEAAFLKAWRKENFNLSDDISEISERRILMMNKLVETIDKRERIYSKSNQGKIDFYGEGFKKVFESFLKKVEKTFTDVNVPEQFRNIFFAQLAKEMDGFERSAENIYYGKKKR